MKWSPTVPPFVQGGARKHLPCHLRCKLTGTCGCRSRECGRIIQIKLTLRHFQTALIHKYTLLLYLASIIVLSYYCGNFSILKYQMHRWYWSSGFLHYVTLYSQYITYYLYCVYSDTTNPEISFFYPIVFICEKIVSLFSLYIICSQFAFRSDLFYIPSPGWFVLYSIKT